MFELDTHVNSLWFVWTVNRVPAVLGFKMNFLQKASYGLAWRTIVAFSYNFQWMESFLAASSNLAYFMLTDGLAVPCLHHFLVLGML